MIISMIINLINGSHVLSICSLPVTELRQDFIYSLHFRDEDRDSKRMSNLASC